MKRDSDNALEGDVKRQMLDQSGAHYAQTSGDAKIFPQRPGMQKCQYYLNNGTCKYGETCRWDHPIDRATALKEQGGGYQKNDRLPDPMASLPPFRPGQPDCTFYMKTGTCKFGETCKFNHPLPKSLTGGLNLNPYGMPGQNPFDALQGMGGVGALLQNAFSHAPAPGAGHWEAHVNHDGQPYYFNPVTMQSQWDPPAELMQQHNPMSALSQFMGGAGGMGMAGMGMPGMQPPGGGFPFDASFLAQTMMGMSQPLLPQRPGEPECQYYIKTGKCKYADTCKFHHPIGGISQQIQYPVRPGEPECSFYMKTGACKYGPTCKYNHPPSSQGGPSRVQPLVGGKLPPLPTVPIPGAPPERPGEPECSFYMRTGKCKFGPSCKFHHPAGHVPGLA